jgi:hypothetical protein
MVQGRHGLVESALERDADVRRERRAERAERCFIVVVVVLRTQYEQEGKKMKGPRDGQKVRMRMKWKTEERSLLTLRLRFGFKMIVCLPTSRSRNVSSPDASVAKPRVRCRNGWRRWQRPKAVSLSWPAVRVMEIGICEVEWWTSESQQSNDGDE